MTIRPIRIAALFPKLHIGPMRSFVRTSTIVVLGNLLVAIFGLVALRIYTHLVPAHLFGAANLVLGVLGLGYQAIIQPVNATQLRYHTEASRAGHGNDFTRQALRWALAAAALAALLCAFAIYFGGEGANASMLVAAILWIVGSATRNVFASRFHAEQRMTGYVAIRVAEAALFVLATSILLTLAPSAEAFVWGQVLAFAFVLLGIGLLAPWPVLGAIRQIATAPPAMPGFREKLRRYGAPFIPMALLQWLANMGDRYVLASLLGATAAGQYLAPFAIASRGFVLANGVMTDLFRPRLFDAETRGEPRRAHGIFLAWIGVYVAISAVGLAAVAVLGNWIVWLLLAASYREGAVAIMLWVGVGYSINGLTTAFENRLFSLGHSARILPPLGFGAVGNVLFALVLIPSYGVIGAAQANCLSFTVQFVVTAFVLWRALRTKSALPPGRAAS